MNHSQETELLDQTAQVIDADLRQAYQRMLALIDDGMPPRKASETVLAEFSGQYADTMAAGLSEILGKAVGTAAVREMKVGGLSLSARLYAESQATSSVVAAIIANNGKGWDDARKLALAIYEGYEFKKGEALNISPTNDKLPKYLRNELLTDRGLRGDLARHFTKIHTANLKSPALKAGYMQYLDALEKGAGQNVLDRKLEIAFHERMRYFANRIAQTELHRAWTDKQAAELMADDEIEFVQIRLSATHPEMDICDLFAGQNKYGLGPGVYRKAEAPKPPFHPFCRCMCSPRLDLTGAKARAKPSAEREFLRKLSVRDGARVMGSQQKLVTVLNGQAAVDDVLNAGRDPMYRLAKVGVATRKPPKPAQKPASLPAQKPVAAAGPGIESVLVLPTKGAVKQAADIAVPAINKVHALPPGLRKIPVESFRNPRAYGSYGHMRNGAPTYIKVSSASPHKPLTLLHEIGHFIDHQSIDGKAGSFASKSSARIMAAWHDAIDESRASAAIARVRGETRHAGTRAMCDYYLGKHEQWARSYAQYIAERSGDQTLMKQVDAIRKAADPLYKNTQWDDNDFEPIARAIDGILTELGLKK